MPQKEDWTCVLCVLTLLFHFERKILSAGAELAGTQNMLAKTCRNRGKSTMSMSMQDSSSVIGSTAALLMTDRYCCDVL